MGGWLDGWAAGCVVAYYAYSYIHINTNYAYTWGGRQTSKKLKRKFSISFAELKVYQKNIHKTRRQAGGFIRTTCLLS